MAATGAFGVSSGGTITTRGRNRRTRRIRETAAAPTSARLSFPQGVAVDDEGNVYIADSKNNRVRKVSPGGRITTFAGHGQAGLFRRRRPERPRRRLNDPQAVAVDAEGNVYIAEQLGQRVRKVTPGGIITTFAGTGDPTSSGDGGPASSASVFYPMGVAVDGRGGVYITGPHGIRKVSGGTITTIVPSTQKLAPQGVAVDRKGNVYVADWYDAVRKVTPGGKITTFAGGGTSGLGDGGPATSAKLGSVFGVAVDKQGTVYISDPGHNRVRRGRSGWDDHDIRGHGRPGLFWRRRPRDLGVVDLPDGAGRRREGERLHRGPRRQPGAQGLERTVGCRCTPEAIPVRRRRDEGHLQDAVRQHRLRLLSGVRQLRDQERARALATADEARLLTSRSGVSGCDGASPDGGVVLPWRGRARRRAFRRGTRCAGARLRHEVE